MTGGIGNNATESDIASFLRDVIYKAMAPAKPSGDPVLNTYVNSDKCFCFMELNSIELTTACCSLDGISYNGNTLKIRRPNDFRPEAMPAGLSPPPVFNLAALGIVGTTVAEGPGKVFVGGLPYHLTEDEIKELLGAFGPLRSFHLVKDTGRLITFLTQLLTQISFHYFSLFTKPSDTPTHTLLFHAHVYRSHELEGICVLRVCGHGEHTLGLSGLKWYRKS